MFNYWWRDSRWMCSGAYVRVTPHAVGLGTSQPGVRHVFLLAPRVRFVVALAVHTRLLLEDVVVGQHPHLKRGGEMGGLVQQGSSAAAGRHDSTTIASARPQPAAA